MDRLLQAQLEDDPLLTEAAAWFFQMRSDDISGERIIEWQQWLADAGNRDAFGRVEALWRLLDHATVRWPTEAEVTADRYCGAESITSWRHHGQPRPAPAARKRPTHRWHRPDVRLAITGIAAAAALALLAAAYWPALTVALQGGSRIAIATGIGETQTVRLSDGSVISAGADTRLVATLLQRSRTVVLTRGEAYFRVVRNPTRPLTVRAGSTTVTDIGTAFDVRRTLDGVVVAVAEGVVNVATRPRSDAFGAIKRLAGAAAAPAMAPIQLTAGQRLAVESFATQPLLSSVKPGWVGGWRDGRLQYVDEPLDAVVSDLARYSDRRITIASPAVGALRVTGVVDVNNIRGWLDSLQATFPVRVSSDQNGATTLAPGR